MSEIGDILVKALDVINTRGWCQYRLRDEAGRVCAQGAVLEAMGLQALFNLCGPRRELFDGAIRVLGHHTGADCWDNLGAITTYNNAPERTIEDIKTLFEKAALDEGISLGG
jgi:hypothetical protein